jgi:hypothetical protein
MQWIKRTWRGEEKLWKVFWVYGVGLSLVGFFTALAVSIWAAMSIGVIGSPSESTWYFGRYTWSAVSICYFVWITISLWRCAFNLEKRVLGYGARVLAVCVALAATYHFTWEHIK